MADGGRSTKRERRDEAKKRRLEEIKRRRRRTRLRKIYSVATIVVVMAGLATWIVIARANAGKKDKAFNTIAVAAGCERLQNPSVITGTHITPPAKGSYNTDPPTSGAHYNVQNLGPLPTGVSTQEVVNEGYVHNLEHGHIVVFYKPELDTTLLAALVNVVKTDPQWMLIAPRASMPFQLAFTAWGHLEGCNSPNAKTADLLTAFEKRFKDGGPEQNRPGTPAGV